MVWCIEWLDDSKDDILMKDGSWRLLFVVVIAVDDKIKEIIMNMYRLHEERNVNHTINVNYLWLVLLSK